MTKNDFVIATVNAVIQKLGAGYIVEPTEKEVTNGLKQTGIGIRKEDVNIAPIIYIDDMYDKLMDPVKAADEVVRIYDANKNAPIINTENLTDWDWVKDNIELRLLNKKTNFDLYKSAEQFGFDDLIIVPYIKVGEHMSARITNNLLSMYNDVTLDDLINIGLIDAKKNARRENKGLPFDIVSNSELVFGAISIIALRDELRQEYPNGYYVIPSSIHEVLVIPTDMVDEDHLNEMVQSVNKSCLDPKDILSDKAYKITK